MSTPEARLRAVLGLAEHEVALRDLWRDLAEKNIEMGTDWPFIARTLYRDIDRLLAARPEPVSAPDSERHVVHVTAKPVAEDVVWCDECEEWVESGTPDSADDATVSGGLDDGEREALASGYTPPMDRIRDEYVEMRRQHYGFADLYAAEFDRALAARDAAWVERLAAVKRDRDEWGRIATQRLVAQVKALAERDTARREAGERIALAIEAHPSPHLTRIYAARIARADALTSDDGGGARQMTVTGRFRAAPPMAQSMGVNTQIVDAIKAKQEDRFAKWLQEKGLTDYRHMPYGEDRNNMKQRTFRALYGGDN